MGIALKVYDNGDHTCLVWLPVDGKAIKDCRGFSIHRIVNGKEDYLHGFVGFSETDKFNPSTPWTFPLQRYLWWDYGVNLGDKVQYSVIPVIGPSADKLTLDTSNASPQTPEMTITGQSTPHISSYFNKGIVATQWVSRALDAAPKNSRIKNLVQMPGTPLRNELSGLLRVEILSLLATTLKNKGKIYAALYELDDEELLTALEAFGHDCNLILANGAFNPKKPDENKDVRAEIGKTVTLFNRMVGTGHFAHNKFVVFCDASGAPQSVLTGSTNWTSSGLCTQANNGIIINDPTVAQDYLDYWTRMKAAGNDYPAPYVTANSTAKTFDVDSCKITPWCVPTSGAPDLDYARKLISAAKEGILFLFFNPGVFEADNKPKQWTLLQNILNRHQKGAPDYNPDLYMRGVVNQQIANLTGPAKTKAAPSKSKTKVDPVALANHPVSLISAGNQPAQHLGQEVLVPRNIKDKFFSWEKELLGASMVNIHSKVIVIDPFGENPVVITGSHNLGFKASSKNDDNMMVIEGNSPLAAAYAVNIIAIYQNYRWNSYVEAHRQDPKNWHGLEDDDSWQNGYLQGTDLAEIKFWIGGTPVESSAGGSAKGAPQPPATKPKVVQVHNVHAASTHATVSHKKPASAPKSKPVTKKPVKKTQPKKTRKKTGKK